MTTVNYLNVFENKLTFQYLLAAIAIKHIAFTLGLSCTIYLIIQNFMDIQ